MSTASSRAAPARHGTGTDTAAPRTHAIDRLLGAWAALTGLLLLLPGRPASWPLLATCHIALAWLALPGPGALRLRAAVTARAPRPARTLHHWYPLLLIPLLYTELEPLNIAVHGGRMFDPIIIALEQLLFDGQPSREWAAAMPSLALSEALHAAYLSYYAILYVPALIVWFRCTDREFRELVFSLMLAFVVHYLFFIFFPVEGPRYRNPAPGGGIENGALYQLTHRLLEAGSSRGAAFPSSHVGASVAVAVATLRLIPPLGIAVAVLAIGVGLGAVYGGFHYAIDALAGLLLGGLAALAAPALQRRIERAPRT